MVLLNEGVMTWHTIRLHISHQGILTNHGRGEYQVHTLQIHMRYKRSTDFSQEPAGFCQGLAVTRKGSCNAHLTRLSSRLDYGLR